MSKVTATDAALHKYLTFYLNSVKYGINILRVREILSNTQARITPLADCPNYVRGVIHLRGTVIPIINLRARLCMPTTDTDSFNAIVIVEKEVDGKMSHQGLLVDTVASVMNIEPDNIKQLDIPGSCTSQEYFVGVAHTDEYEVILIDPNYLLTNSETSKLSGLTKAV